MVISASYPTGFFKDYNYNTDIHFTPNSNKSPGVNSSKGSSLSSVLSIFKASTVFGATTSCPAYPILVYSSVHGYDMTDGLNSYVSL